MLGITHPVENLMSKKAVILLLVIALAILWGLASNRWFGRQLRLIEAQCERAVAIELQGDALPKGKVCEVTGTDIWIHVDVRAGRHSYMECDEPIWPFEDVTKSCRFGP